MTQRLTIVSLASLLILSTSNRLHAKVTLTSMLSSVLIADYISHPGRNPINSLQKKLGMTESSPVGKFLNAFVGNKEIPDLPEKPAKGGLGHIVTFIERVGEDMALCAATKATLYTFAYMAIPNSLLSNFLKKIAHHIPGFSEDTTMEAFGLEC